MTKSLRTKLDLGGAAEPPTRRHELGSFTVAFPAAGVLSSYLVVLVVDAVLIVLTLLSDLKVDFALSGLARQFDLKLEGNFAVWYSSLLLLLSGLGAFCVGQLMRRRECHRFSPLLWWFAAMSFVGLSIDETARLHEKVGIKFVTHFGTVPGLTDGAVPAFAWLLALAPLIVLFVICMVVAARQIALVNSRSRNLLLAGVACWMGVLAAEFTQAQLQRAGMERSIQGVIEEGLEILGATLFFFAFVEACRISAGRVGAPPGLRARDG